MSSFSGAPDGTWSLRDAVAALGQSARAAGRPGLIWIAGLGYPAVGAGLGLGSAQGWALVFSAGGGLSGEQLLAGGLATSLVGLPLYALFARLSVGLARIAPPEVWGRLRATLGKVRLSQAWRAGSGLALSALGLALLASWMLVLPVLALGLPLALLFDAAEKAASGGGEALVGTLLGLPLLALLASLSVVLSAVHQLALLSLAHNRRGVASALIHGWRLTREDPWASGRTLAVDAVLSLTVFLLYSAASAVLSALGLAPLAWIAIQLPLLGYLGVVRAGYWARAYRALGGLSPDDSVPGLAAHSASA